ncbi:MAG: ABC transporter permease [Bacteroidales bacterium]|nr:ABC transporter permease [Bacteroidales bacterium]
MNKIFLVIKREYLSRVKKKSFIIMTLLAPVFLAGIIIVPAWLMSRETTDVKKIAVVGEGSRLFNGKIPSTRSLKFDFLTDANPDELKNNFLEQGYYGVLMISPKITYIPNAIQLYSQKQPTMDITSHISNALEKEIEREKLEAYNIEDIDKILKEIKSDVNVQTILISDTGEEKKTSTGLAMGIAYISGLMIYMLTFIFGAQVMRGVIEEKTSRIVEILISSVKPFQLMMGKILGIALVGLTQFILWIVLTLAIVGTAQAVLLPDMNVGSARSQVVESVMSGVNESAGEQVQAIQPQLNELQGLLQAIKSMNWGLIIGSFLIYFLGGYLLYASLFAAVGSAVDNETDTQQFMIPITIPLLLGLFVSMSAFQNPDSSIVYWCSFIPFTSPMVMMARIPFGVPGWELALSMIILLLSFVGMAWLAAKIYRIGILMYGKKPTYKEMFKWLRY